MNYLSRNLVHVRLKSRLNNDFVQNLHLNRASATTETRLFAFRIIHSVARVACVCRAFVAVAYHFCEHLAVWLLIVRHARISWQCIVIVSRAWVSWQYCTEEMIRLRGVAWDDSLAGCRIRTVSNLRWWTLVYWDFTGTHQSFYWVSHPMFRLPGVACEHSRVLPTVLLWRVSFTRRSSHASRGEALLIMLLLSVSFARRGVKD